MTTVVTRSMGPAPLRDFDRDVDRVGDHVVDRRPFLRLRDDRLDLLLRRVSVDLEGDLDVVVAVADVAVHPEDSADVHLAFELRLDRAQLDAPILGHRGNAGGQAAGEADEHVFDRRDPLVFGGEDLGMIRRERRLGLVLLLLAKAEEAADVRHAVRASLPFTGRAPRELCCFRRAFQCFPRVQQRLHVDAVVHRRHSHRELPLTLLVVGSWKARIIQRRYDARMPKLATAPTPGSAGIVETQFLDLPRPLKLDCGTELYPVRVAYETYGTLSPARDNVILVCHALSGDAHAAGISATPAGASTRDGFRAEERDADSGRGLGWWDGMIGPGKAFDTDQFFVVSTNLLGGCRGTTGPSSLNPATGRPYGADFPVITVADMVRAQRAFLTALGIPRLAAVAGGSLGGMQALEWAVLYADQVDAVVAIASTHALLPQGVAWNAIARNAITADPDWQGGHYHGTGRAPNAGMGVARMVGHVTYLSAASLGDKFGRRLQFSDDIRYTLTEPEFEVENYLRHQAAMFVRRFDANTYLYTSRALSYFDLARQYGGGQLADAVRNVSARTLLIAFSSDWLYPPSGSEELAAALRAGGKPVDLHVIDAPYGHDCFLLEEARQIPIVREFLGRDPVSGRARVSSGEC